jgi:transposase
MAPFKLYASQRRRLEEVVRHPADTRQLRRAQALLWVDAGESVGEVAQRLRVTRQSIYNWIDRIHHREGFVAERLRDAPRSGRPAKKSEVVDPVVALLLGSDPHQYGYWATGWTNGLLRNFLQRHCDLKVSHQTVRKAIKRAGYRWKRPRYVLSRRPNTWRQAKGGLKRGLKGRIRTVILMVDATILTQIPPLRAAYAPIGEQAVVPITGDRSKRVVFGVLNIKTGRLELLITTHWEGITFQAFLRQIRRLWRGWHIVLFLDRGSPHRAQQSQALAKQLAIELRWLPVATPELNAMEPLWQDGKEHVCANRTTHNIEDTADAFCHYLLNLTSQQRLKKAGVLSGTFWLTK